MKLSPQDFHWQSCRQFLEKMMMNFIVLGTGSLSRAQEGWEASLGPMGGSLAADQDWCFLLQRTLSIEKTTSVFPHIQAYNEVKERNPEKEPKPTGLSCASYDIYIFIFNPCMLQVCNERVKTSTLRETTWINVTLSLPHNQIHFNQKDNLTFKIFRWDLWAQN